MPDLDAYKAGGATGALKRAAQLSNLRANNANRLANALRRRTRKPPVPRGGRPMATGGEGKVAPAVSKPPPVAKAPQQEKLFDIYGRPINEDGKLLQGPGLGGPVSVGGVPEILGSYTNPDPENLTPDSTSPVLLDDKGKPQAVLPGTAGAGYVGIADWQLREGTELDRYAGMTPEEQIQVRENVKGTREGGKVAKTVNQMLDDIKKDPIQDSERFIAGQDLADAFRDDSKVKYFTDDDLAENPFLATLNDLSVWSTYRLKVSEWNTRKNKTGDAPTDAGDGTYTGLVDNGSFSSVTSPSNLSPYLVTRDEHGLLQVVTADQWIQGKFTQMRNDPAFAAEMVTALAMTSAYGTDSSANNQRSRVSLDAEGNPVKAFVSIEDLNALKQLANEVAIFQAQGDEVAIDDSIAELVGMAAEVNDINAGNGEYGGGGGGRGYSRGYGGGGGYGGGSGAVRYTDATQLTALVGSIGRQRMGRELTPEEAAQFVQYYHGLEEQSTAAYYAGQSNTQLDPEGQAIAWITGHFQRDAATHQYGNLAASFFSMMGTSNPFAGIT